MDPTHGFLRFDHDLRLRTRANEAYRSETTSRVWAGVLLRLPVLQHIKIDLVIDLLNGQFFDSNDLIRRRARRRTPQLLPVYISTASSQAMREVISLCCMNTVLPYDRIHKPRE